MTPCPRCQLPLEDGGDREHRCEEFTVRVSEPIASLPLGDTVPDAVYGSSATRPRPLDPVPRRAALDEDAPALVLGTQVGEYVVTGPLGAGGMGTVYAGVHPVIGKKVAIKVLNAGLSRDPLIMQRFVQEARSVNQIGHRNIVDIFAFGELPGGRQYFVMEYLPGRSLQARLRAGALTFEEAFRILFEVCDALAAAHAEGIVHRDLKPDNIYLAEAKDGGCTVKLLDFGIAKLVREGGDAPLQQTDTGSLVGTPLYMSPEQCTGRAVDARSDVYALGVILFELFTGRLPFPGPSYAEAVSGHLAQPPPRPSQYVDLPAALDALILKCLAKSPGERPQGVLEVRAALERIAERLGPSELGKLTTAGLSCVLATTLLRRPDPITPQPLNEALRDRTSRRWLVWAGSVVGVGGLVLGVALGLHGKEIVPALEGAKLPVAAASQAPTGAAQGTRLQVHTQAERATWTLDGKVLGERGGMLALEEVAPGPHRLRVEAPNFAPREETLSLRPHAPLVVEWTLAPLPTTPATAR